MGGFEKVKLYSTIEFDLDASFSGTVTVSTDLAGGPYVIGVAAVPVRTTLRLRLPGSLKGRLVRVVYNSSGVTRLYGARIFARELAGGAWQWYPLPVPETPNEFSAVQLPIPATSEEWQAAPLPIAPTAQEWQAVPLPIPPTSEEWRAVPLPIAPTPPMPEWVDVQVDQ